MSLRYVGNTPELKRKFPLNIKEAVFFYGKAHEELAEKIPKIRPKWQTIVLPNYSRDSDDEIGIATIGKDMGRSFVISGHSKFAGLYVNGRTIMSGTPYLDVRKISADKLGSEDIIKQYIQSVVCGDRKTEDAGNSRTVLKYGDIISIAGETFIFEQRIP